MMQLVSPNAALNERIELFVATADEIVAEYWKKNDFKFAPAPTHRADYVSDKWVKVMRVEKCNDGTHREQIYAFICLQDYFTKTLGQLKTGDIHKSASSSQPAKHARGNIFASDFDKAMTPNGIVYLRG